MRVSEMAWADVEAWLAQDDFPWTRLANRAPPPGRKPITGVERLPILRPEQVRAVTGDGNYGGPYARGGDEMLAISGVAADEVRALPA